MVLNTYSGITISQDVPAITNKNKADSFHVISSTPLQAVNGVIHSVLFSLNCHIINPPAV